MTLCIHTPLPVGSLFVRIDFCCGMCSWCRLGAPAATPLIHVSSPLFQGGIGVQKMTDDAYVSFLRDSGHIDDQSCKPEERTQ